MPLFVTLNHKTLLLKNDILSRWKTHYIPLLKAVFALTIGIFASGFLPDVKIVSLAIVAVCIVSMAFVYSKRSYKLRRLPIAFLLVAMFSFGCAWQQIRTTTLINYNGNAIIIGHVEESIGFNAKYAKYQFCADSILFNDSLLLDRTGILSVPFDNELLPGTQIKTNAYLFKPKSPSNPGVFDYSSYLVHNGFSFTAYSNLSDAEYFGNHSTVTTFFANLRLNIMSLFSQFGISDSSSSFLQAIFLGDKSRLDFDRKQSFSNCGVIHLLAVSGLHVGIIYLFISFFIGLFCGNRFVWLRFALVMLFMWSYAVMTGLSPSVLRAVIMMSMVDLSRCLGYESYIFNTLVVSLFLILLIDPNHAFSIGLWFSFFSVLSIVVFYPFFNGLFQFRFPPFAFLYKSLSVTLSAQLGTLPLTLCFFHSFPTYFMLNNLILIPLAAPILILAILIVITSFVPLLPLMLAALLEELIQFFIQYVESAGDLPLSTIRGINFDAISCALLMFIICYLMYQISTKRFALSSVIPTLVASTLLVSWIGLRVLHSEKKVGITIFDSYGKESMVALIDGRKTTYLLDTSSINYFEPMIYGHKVINWNKNIEYQHNDNSCKVDIGANAVWILNKNVDYDGDAKFGNIFIVSKDVYPPAFALSKCDLVVVQSSVTRSVMLKWRSWCDENMVAFKDVAVDGAVELCNNSDENKNQKIAIK